MNICAYRQLIPIAIGIESPTSQGHKTLAASVADDLEINNKHLKQKIMTWWILLGVGITFLTLILAGAYKKKK
jgi:hypothetical protein